MAEGRPLPSPSIGLVGCVFALVIATLLLGGAVTLVVLEGSASPTSG